MVEVPFTPRKVQQPNHLDFAEAAKEILSHSPAKVQLRSLTYLYLRFYLLAGLLFLSVPITPPQDEPKKVSIPTG